MKNTYIRIRLTEQEKEMLKKLANKNGMSMSDYVKYCCLMQPQMKTEEMKRPK